VPIYLGETGFVELQRSSDEKGVVSPLNPSDVNVTRKRFSVEKVSGAILIGDKISIATEDGSNLELISGHNFNQATKFVNIDPIGGMRLYNSFADAIEGKITTALTLVTPSSTKNIIIKVQNPDYRPLARVKEFEFTSNREQVNVEGLGDEFKRYYESGLIGGQGSLTCLWEHQYAMSDPETSLPIKPEFSGYLASLCLRLQSGSQFFGRFFIYKSGNQSKDNTWYETEALVTNCSLQVPAVGVVETRIEFVSTGPFQLKMGSIPAYLLQEDSGFILQDPDSGKIFLEDDAA
tara:strand:+ start:10652 stop:11527 length:876 start_codon:yes stop_codon:yes gene_type:complete